MSNDKPEKRVPTEAEQYEELKRYFQSHGLGSRANPSSSDQDSDQDDNTPDGAA